MASLSRYFGTSSAITREDAAAISDGLRMTALPAAIAASFSSISFCSWSSWRLRHSTSRVRPVAKV
ncbi:hypothetical protein PICSAR14_04609 [Mycobacterium avium subsp. paratuberculosis]|nr:hypothetical protein PICSAR14_04609 [Mycobacterium avium subsp. paratuberculosis]